MVVGFDPTPSNIEIRTITSLDSINQIQSTLSNRFPGYRGVT
jgi:hypothetical protein